MHEDNPPITSVCFAPNGRYVLAFSMDSCLRLWDYVSGTVKKTYQGHENSKFSIGGCFGSTPLPSANGDVGTGGNAAFIAAPSEDGDIVLWDVRSKAVVQRISRAHDGVCFWVDVHGPTMVSAGQDGKIRVYRHQGPEADAGVETEKKKKTKKNADDKNDKNGDADVEMVDSEKNDNGIVSGVGGVAVVSGGGGDVVVVAATAGTEKEAEAEAEANQQKPNGVTANPKVEDEGSVPPLKDEDVKKEE